MTVHFFNVLGLSSLLVAFVAVLWGLAPAPMDMEILTAAIIGQEYITHQIVPMEENLKIVRASGYSSFKVKAMRNSAEVILQKSGMSKKYKIDDDEKWNILSIKPVQEPVKEFIQEISDKITFPKRRGLIVDLKIKDDNKWDELDISKRKIENKSGEIVNKIIEKIRDEKAAKSIQLEESEKDRIIETMEINLGRRQPNPKLKKSDLSTDSFLVEENEQGEIMSIKKIVETPWRELSKEQWKEYHHLFYLKNRKKWLKYSLAYYAKHKEEIREQQKKRYLKDRSNLPEKEKKITRGKKRYKAINAEWNNSKEEQEVVSTYQDATEEVAANELFDLIRKHLQTLSVKDKEIADRIIQGAKDSDIAKAYQVEIDHVVHMRESLKEIIEKAGY